MKNDTRKTLVGRRFGRLVVIQLDYTKPSDSSNNWTKYYKCKCDCGQEKVVKSSCLIGENTKSCGCLNKESREARRDKLENQKFGDLTVICRADKNKWDGRYFWNCECVCGKKLKILGFELKSGKRINCGCQRISRNLPIGYKRTADNGYVLIKVSISRRGDKGWKYEHTYVMEQLLGRKLFKGETVHHKNGIKSDNRPDNLELWVKHQPVGQRVADVLDFCRNFIKKYETSEARIS